MYIALAIYAVFLLILAVSLDGSTLERAFSEAGPFERLSIAFWLLLAVALLAGRRAALRHRVTLAVTACLLAAREASWHKAFTSDSLFKTNYYEDPTIPLAEKLIAGPVAMALLTLLVVVLIYGGRLLLQGGWRRPWMRTAIFGVLITAATKVVDRAPAILAEDYGIVLPELTARIIQALEEGVEMALPPIFLVALLQYGLRRGAGSAGIAHTGGDTVDADH